MKKNFSIIRTIYGIIGGLALCYSIFIIFFVHIKNIGSLLIAVLGVMLSAIFIFYKKIAEFIRVFTQKTIGKIIAGIISAIIIAIVAVGTAGSIFMVKANNIKPQEDATVIILGCRVRGETPSLMLKERLDAAYTYLFENETAVCVLSGGQGNGENISEAECMYRYLTEKGISPDRLYKEGNSTSTDENIRFSYKIIKENNLSTNTAIVTNEFHEYRARLITEKYGLTFGAVSGKTKLRLFPAFYVRELCGILYEWVK